LASLWRWLGGGWWMFGMRARGFLSSHSVRTITDRALKIETLLTGQIYVFPPISTEPYSIMMSDRKTGVVDFRSAASSKRRMAPLAGSIVISP
jgi:hypothetical protein